MKQQKNQSNRRRYDPFKGAQSFNLCGRCLDDYRSTGSYLIRRNYEVEYTDTCLFYNVRRGFEYFVVSRNAKPKQGDSNE